ncbi:expressed conserved protein [Echinococcus multilocularis]|uniref:Expressed conserved protein n=1 Tax=Echinococcus multilocularis TaxID=6211 RepID=A0A087W1S8_ECHMU|nr:expressed conserved protein [Echinococcus multilocularis]
MRVRGCKSMCCTVLTPQFRSAVVTRPSVEWDQVFRNDEGDLKADTVSTSKRDRDGKKLRESVLASWLKTASDRRKKLQTLMDEYNELVIAVKRGQ